MNKIQWITIGLALSTVLASPVMVKAAPTAPESDVISGSTFFDREGQKLVYFAVLEGLYDQSIPDAVIAKVLVNDNQGRPVSFILGCPICHPVYDAFQTYRTRPSFFKSDRRDFSTTDQQDELHNEIKMLNSEKPMERTAAVGRLVRRWVQIALAKQNLSSAEMGRWATRLKAMSEVGQSKLSEHQRNGVEAYKLMWSCMLCDGAVKGSKVP
jgi:hypothetical protein